MLLALRAALIVFATAAAPSDGIDASIDDADAAARAVFDGPDFWWKRVETPRVSVSWLGKIFDAIWKAIGDVLGRIMRAIGNWLARLFRGLLPGSGNGHVGFELIVVLLASVLLGLALWKLSGVVREWLGDRELAPMPETIAVQPLAESSQVLEEALQALRDGMYAESIRLALLALIARLEKRGLLRYDTSRTNREYQRELRSSSELADGFGRLARVYERVWYGGKAADRDTAEQAIAMSRTLIAGEGLAPE